MIAHRDRPARVSLVMPCFNGGLYVAEAINSVLSQSRPPDEIILVDDGSSDDSARRIADFSDRIIYLRQEHSGVCAARNRGVEASSGDLLAFLDVDDLWTEGSLKSLLRLLEADEIGYGFGSVEQFYSEDLDARARASLSASSLIAGRLAGAMLIRRATWDRVGPFDPSLTAGEMVDWVARANAIGVASRSTDEVVLRRRIHAANSVHRRDAYRASQLRALRTAVRLQKTAAPC